MNTFPLTVSSPDGALFTGDAQRVTLRGAEGDLAIMAGHVPFITSVQPGECRVLLEDGSEKVFKVQGGLLTVRAEGVTLLCFEE